MINLPVLAYLKNIYLPIWGVVVLSVILPIYVYTQMDEGFVRFIIVGLACVVSVGVSALFVGMTRNERTFLVDKSLRILKVRK